MAVDSLQMNDSFSTLQSMGYPDHYIRRAFTVYKKLNSKRDTAFQLSLLVEIIDRLKQKDALKQQKLHQNQASQRHRLQSVYHPPPQHPNYPSPVHKPHPPPAKHVQNRRIHQHHQHSPQQQQHIQPAKRKQPRSSSSSITSSPFIPHFHSTEQAQLLNANDCVDYRYENGRYILCRILSKTVNYNQHTVLVLHPEGTPVSEHKYDRYCDINREYHKLATAHSITSRKIRDRNNVFNHLKLGECIDVNPLYRPGHVGWKHGRVVKIDPYASQIKVSYVHTVDHATYSYWLHLENKMEAAPFNTRCQPQMNDADEGCQSGEENESITYDEQFTSPTSSADNDANTKNRVFASSKVAQADHADAELDMLDDVHSPRNQNMSASPLHHSVAEEHVSVIPNVRLNQRNMLNNNNEHNQQQQHVQQQQQQVEPSRNSRSIFAQLNNGSFLLSDPQNEQKSNSAAAEQKEEKDDDYKRHEIKQQLQTFGYASKDIEVAMQHVADALDINQVIEHITNHEMDNMVKDKLNDDNDDDDDDDAKEYEEEDDESRAPRIKRTVTGSEFDSELKTMATGNDLMIDDIISEMDEDSEMKEDHLSPYFTPMGGPPVNHLNIGKPLNPNSPNRPQPADTTVQPVDHYSKAQREWMAKYAQETPSNDLITPNALSLVSAPNDHDDDGKDEHKQIDNNNNNTHLKPGNSQKRKSLRTRMQGQILNELFHDNSKSKKKKKKSSVFGQKSLKSAGGGKERVFGVDGILLSSTLILDKDYNAPIPNILIKLKEELFEHNGHLMEGIFRISPKAAEYQRIESRLDKGEIFEINFDELDCELIASLIKVWFRKLPHGILDDIIYKIGDGEKCTTPQFVAQIIQNEMNEPLQSYYKWILDLCLEIVKYEDENKMSMRAMAVVIAPNLYDVEKVKNTNSAQNAIHVSNVVVKFVELSILWRHLQEKSLSHAAN